MLEEKLKQFINKWNGKKLEAYDSSNLYQCYDLITAWCQELGIKPPMTLYAYQIFSQDYQQFDKIKNEKDNHPEAGDIVVWGKSYNGTAGHTAVATGNQKTEGKASDWFEAFSQNDPIGAPSILKKYSYNYVLGWLRPKKEFIKEQETYYKGIDLSNIESVKVAIDTWHQVAVEGLFIKKEEHERIIRDKENTIVNLNQNLNILNSQNTELGQEKNKLADELKVCQEKEKSQSEQLDNLNKELEILRSDKIQYEKNKSDWQLKEVALNKQIALLTTKYNATKSSIKKLLIDYIFGKNI